MKHRTFFKIYLLLVFLATSILSTVSHVNEVAVIGIKDREAQELAPIVQSLLSPDGHLSLDIRVNSLVIVDNPAAIRRVHDYLNRFDVLIERLRIRARFSEKQSAAQRSASIDGIASGKDGRIATDKQNKNSIEVNIENRKRDQISVSEYFVITSSPKS